MFINKWKIIGQGKAERLPSQEIGKGRPMAKEYLKTHGHREATKTAERCCSDHIPQLWSGISAPPVARREGEFTWSSGSEPIELPILPIHLIQPQTDAEWQSPSRQLQGQGEFHGSHPHQCHNVCHFVY